MIQYKNHILITGKHQKPILTDVYFDNNNQPKAIVILCHGYKGFKDWGAWDLVAKAFANHGFFFIKFNFSHNGGTVEQPIDFPDIEAFGNNNFCKELDDLETVIDWVYHNDFEFKKEIDLSNLVVVGHSRGGAIATIKAAEDSRITKLITWASISDFKSRFPKGKFLEEWKKSGVMYVENKRTKQQLPHYYQMYLSFMANEERLTIKNAVKKIQIPHLIIHGTEDPTVPVAEGKKIHDWNPDSMLVLIKNADHVFEAKHPWPEQIMPKALQLVIEKSIQFL